MSQNRAHPPRSSASGIALVVSLVLLLVMTMVAVVAMRSTTLDIKMSANSMLSHRAFENSDGARDMMTPVIDAHVFYHGWPAAMGCSTSTVPGGANFPTPTGMSIADCTKRLDLGQNGLYSRFNTTPVAPDLTMADGTAGSMMRIEANLWVTRISTIPAAGNTMNSNSADQGVGGGAANKYVVFDLSATGASMGNATSRTGADYRALVR